MKKITDYIFYITYTAYAKKDDPALFNSVVFISCCCFFLSYPFIGTLEELMRNKDGNISGYFMLAFSLLIVFLVSKRYIKNKEDILRIHSKSKYNNQIPTWTVFIVFPICLVLGVGLYIVIMKTVIRPYNLTGYLYNLIWG